MRKRYAERLTTIDNKQQASVWEVIDHHQCRNPNYMTLGLCVASKQNYLTGDYLAASGLRRIHMLLRRLQGNLRVAAIFSERLQTTLDQAH